MRRKTEERIVKIKTDTEELDKNRRTLEDKNKKERANKIQNEVIQSHKKNVEIDWNWQELEEKEDCKELDEVRNHSPPTFKLKTKCNVLCRKLKPKKMLATRSSMKRRF